MPTSIYTPLCNRPPKSKGKFSLGQGAKKELEGSKFIRGHCCFWGILKFLPLTPKRIMWVELRIIQGGHLKIRGDWEKFKYEGAYKISWGFEK